jgi:hypothetical protein
VSECRVPVLSSTGAVFDQRRDEPKRFVGQEANAPSSGEVSGIKSALFWPGALIRRVAHPHRGTQASDMRQAARGSEGERKPKSAAETLCVALAELAAPHGFVDRVQQTRHSE